MGRVAIGIDLGGTKIEAAVVEESEGRFATLLRKRTRTDRELGYDHVLAATRDFLFEIAKEAGLDAATVPAGVGMPGGLTRAGLVKNSNTTSLNGRPFRADLERAAGRSLRFDNDANCFALAETRLGAARAHRDGIVFGVILGTGVGGGVVVRGEVWAGAQGIAGEWGHHAAWADRKRPCYCGNFGCIEAYASGPAVERDYLERSGVARPLAEIAARSGTDFHADAAIEGLVDAFGRGIANVIDILDPSAIVLGGGVSNLDVLYGEGIARARSYVFNDELATPILRNELGDSAGVLGAALLCF